jgi:hypothetical protein
MFEKRAQIFSVNFSKGRGQDYRLVFMGKKLEILFL